MSRVEYKEIELHLRADQYQKVCELASKLPSGHDGGPDGWEVIRGIVDAYFRLCETGGSPTVSPPVSLSQEGSGGGVRRPFVRLLRSVKLGDTTWPAQIKVEVLERSDQAVKVRFPDAQMCMLPAALLKLD